MRNPPQPTREEYREWIKRSEEHSKVKREVQRQRERLLVEAECLAVAANLWGSGLDDLWNSLFADPANTPAPGAALADIYVIAERLRELGYVRRYEESNAVLD